MKTQQSQPETDRLEKEKLIDRFAEVLKQNCSTRHDVESIICSITSANDFLQEFLASSDRQIYNIREIEGIIRDHGNKQLHLSCEEICNFFLRGMILSGQLNLGGQLICRMSDELDQLS